MRRVKEGFWRVGKEVYRAFCAQFEETQAFSSFSVDFKYLNGIGFDAAKHYLPTFQWESAKLAYTYENSAFQHFLKDVTDYALSMKSVQRFQPSRDNVKLSVEKVAAVFVSSMVVGVAEDLFQYSTVSIDRYLEAKYVGDNHLLSHQAMYKAFGEQQDYKDFLYQLDDLYDSDGALPEGRDVYFKRAFNYYALTLLAKKVFGRVLAVVMVLLMQCYRLVFALGAKHPLLAVTGLLAWLSVALHSLLSFREEDRGVSQGILHAKRQPKIRRECRALRERARNLKALLRRTEKNLRNKRKKLLITNSTPESIVKAEQELRGLHLLLKYAHGSNAEKQNILEDVGKGLYDLRGAYYLLKEYGVAYSQADSDDSKQTVCDQLSQIDIEKLILSLIERHHEAHVYQNMALSAVLAAVLINIKRWVKDLFPSIGQLVCSSFIALGVAHLQLSFIATVIVFSTAMMLLSGLCDYIDEKAYSRARSLVKYLAGVVPYVNDIRSAVAYYSACLISVPIEKVFDRPKAGGSSLQQSFVRVAEDLGGCKATGIPQNFFNKAFDANRSHVLTDPSLKYLYDFQVPAG